MKTEKQILLLQEEIGKQLFEKTGNYDSIIIDRKTFDKIRQTMKVKCFNEYNWSPVLSQGVFIQSEDKASQFTDYIIFFCADAASDSENEIVLKLESFQQKTTEKEDRFLWNYSCTAHIYLIDDKGEMNISIAVDSYKDGKSEVLKKQKRLDQCHGYIKATLPSVLDNKMHNFMTLILVMGYLNHISEHPEIKVIESDNKIRKENDNRLETQRKNNPVGQVKPKTVIINGIKVITSDRKVSSGLRSRKPYRFTGAWSVRGHYRHYKSGKTVYIKPYEKGNGKRQKKKFVVE